MRSLNSRCATVSGGAHAERIGILRIDPHHLPVAGRNRVAAAQACVMYTGVPADSRCSVPRESPMAGQSRVSGESGWYIVTDRWLREASTPSDSSCFPSSAACSVCQASVAHFTRIGKLAHAGEDGQLAQIFRIALVRVARSPARGIARTSGRACAFVLPFTPASSWRPRPSRSRSRSLRN